MNSRTRDIATWATILPAFAERWRPHCLDGGVRDMPDKRHARAITSTVVMAQMPAANQMHAHRATIELNGEDYPRPQAPALPGASPTPQGRTTPQSVPPTAGEGPRSVVAGAPGLVRHRAHDEPRTHAAEGRLAPASMSPRRSRTRFVGTTATMAAVRADSVCAETPTPRRRGKRPHGFGHQGGGCLRRGAAAAAHPHVERVHFGRCSPRGGAWAEMPKNINIRATCRCSASVAS